MLIDPCDIRYAFKFIFCYRCLIFPVPDCHIVPGYLFSTDLPLCFCQNVYHFWISLFLDSIPFIYLSNFTPIPHSFEQSSFKVSLLIG